jgi:putative restriction endonuclease
MFYWVNQGKTYTEEKEGGYLWAPIKNSKGNSFFHWENMTKLKPYDIVFNYRKGFVVGYCEIKTKHFLAPQPEEFNVDVEWENEGYMIDADYVLFANPIDIKTAYKNIYQYLPDKYSPINISGENHKIKANQGYLYQCNQMVAQELFKLALIKFDENYNSELNSEETAYGLSRETSKQNLTTLRVGQGEFRQRILRKWNFKCAVNDTSIKEILIASHIVPWREANDEERLDVNNGLLLSPTYDALFDKYLISFEDNGKIILSKSRSKEDFQKLRITGTEKIDNLTFGNKKYLERHREKFINQK